MRVFFALGLACFFLSTPRAFAAGAELCRENYQGLGSQAAKSGPSLAESVRENTKRIESLKAELVAEEEKLRKEFPFNKDLEAIFLQNSRKYHSAWVSIGGRDFEAENARTVKDTVKALVDAKLIPAGSRKIEAEVNKILFEAARAERGAASAAAAKGGTGVPYLDILNSIRKEKEGAGKAVATGAAEVAAVANKNGLISRYPSTLLSFQQRYVDRLPIGSSEGEKAILAASAFDRKAAEYFQARNIHDQFHVLEGNPLAQKLHSAREAKEYLEDFALKGMGRVGIPEEVSRGYFPLAERYAAQWSARVGPPGPDAVQTSQEIRKLLDDAVAKGSLSEKNKKLLFENIGAYGQFPREEVLKQVVEANGKPELGVEIRDQRNEILNAIRALETLEQY